MQLSPLPAMLSNKGATQPEGQDLLYLLVLSFLILSIYKSRVLLALALEHFPGGEAFMWWDVARRGREALTQELEVDSTAAAERMLKEAECQPACRRGNAVFLGTASDLPQVRKLPT